MKSNNFITNLSSPVLVEEAWRDYCESKHKRFGEFVNVLTQAFEEEERVWSDEQCMQALQEAGINPEAKIVLQSETAVAAWMVIKMANSYGVSMLDPDSSDDIEGRSVWSRVTAAAGNGSSYEGYFNVMNLDGSLDSSTHDVSGAIKSVYEQYHAMTVMTAAAIATASSSAADRLAVFSDILSSTFADAYTDLSNSAAYFRSILSSRFDGATVTRMVLQSCHADQSTSTNISEMVRMSSEEFQGESPTAALSFAESATVVGTAAKAIGAGAIVVGIAIKGILDIGKGIFSRVRDKVQSIAVDPQDLQPVANPSDGQVLPAINQTFWHWKTDPTASLEDGGYFILYEYEGPGSSFPFDTGAWLDAVRPLKDAINGGLLDDIKGKWFKVDTIFGELLFSIPYGTEALSRYALTQNARAKVEFSLNNIDIYLRPYIISPGMLESVLGPQSEISNVYDRYNPSLDQLGNFASRFWANIEDGSCFSSSYDDMGRARGLGCSISLMAAGIWRTLHPMDHNNINFSGEFSENGSMYFIPSEFDAEHNTPLAYMYNPSGVYDNMITNETFARMAGIYQSSANPNKCTVERFSPMEPDVWYSFDLAWYVRTMIASFLWERYNRKTMIEWEFFPYIETSLSMNPGAYDLSTDTQHQEAFNSFFNKALMVTAGAVVGLVATRVVRRVLVNRQWKKAIKFNQLSAKAQTQVLTGRERKQYLKYKNKGTIRNFFTGGLMQTAGNVASEASSDSNPLIFSLLTSGDEASISIGHASESIDSVNGSVIRANSSIEAMNGIVDLFITK